MTHINKKLEKVKKGNVLFYFIALICNISLLFITYEYYITPILIPDITNAFNESTLYGDKYGWIIVVSILIEFVFTMWILGEYGEGEDIWGSYTPNYDNTYVKR